MECGKCGTENIEGSRFCKKCGNKLIVAGDKKASISMPGKKAGVILRRRGILLLIIGVPLVAVINGVLSAMWSNWDIGY
jgi:uncharacterized membrane protein YvbJ